MLWLHSRCLGSISLLIFSSIYHYLTCPWILQYFNITLYFYFIDFDPEVAAPALEPGFVTLSCMHGCGPGIVSRGRSSCGPGIWSRGPLLCVAFVVAAPAL